RQARRRRYREVGQGDPGRQHQGRLTRGPDSGASRRGGSMSALVVTSASMRERAVFIGSISVRDTIGTLAAISIEIITVFPPLVCCVMGRKAPRKRLARRVMACPTGASHAPERLSALRRCIG